MTAVKNKNHSDYDLHDDVKKIKDAILAATQDAKGRASEILTESVDNVKEQTLLAKDHVENYTAKKPFTSLGIALAVGAVIGFMLRKRG